jgi:acyl-CoA thioester hydrolase
MAVKGTQMVRSSSFSLRVYYEDTDLAGVVYYANYLKFIERARSEWVRELGIDQAQLKEETGTVFAVRHLTADYIAPAKFDDLLAVTTQPIQLQGARLVLDQQVMRGAQTLFAARVTLVAMSANGAPTRLPAALRAAIG